MLRGPLECRGLVLEGRPSLLISSSASRIRHVLLTLEHGGSGGVMAIFAVTTEKGPNWDEARAMREQESWPEHARFADDLVERGVIIIGGPIGGSDTDIALLAVDAEDEARVETLFGDDPWMLNGVFRIKEVRPWTWWLDGRKDRSAT